MLPEPEARNGADALVRTPSSGRTMSVSLVLPMYNESASVDSTLEYVLYTLGQIFLDFEVIVVDDASTDDSSARVQYWAARDSRILLHRMERNERFGGALRKGLAAAKKDVIVYTDFDLPVELAFLPKIVDEFEHSDIVTGYSAIEPKNVNWRSRVLSGGYNGLVHAAFHLPLRDVNFGFKAMRKSAYAQLRLASRSPFVDAELFIEARRYGHRISEIAVPFLRRRMGASHIRRMDVVVWTMLDMARVWLRGQLSGRFRSASSQ